MKVLGGPWLLLYAAIALGVVGFYMRCPGCVPRDRVNVQCAWTGDSPAKLNLDHPDQRAHLIHDVQLAEELAVRFADRENLRLHGIEHHGGLIDGGAVVLGCMAQMFAKVKREHGVTDEQIETARRHRNGMFEVVNLLLFVPVYWWAATMVHRILERRFFEDSELVRRVATGLTGVVVAILGYQMRLLWGALWNTIRIGNGHVGGYRLATRTAWFCYEGVTVMTGLVLLFLIIGTLHRRIPMHVVRIAATLMCVLVGFVFIHTFARHIP